MSSNVIPLFKNKLRNVAHRIPLYGDEEVKLTIAVIGLFGDQVIRKPYWCIPPHVTPTNLKLYNPYFVIECLKLAINSTVFSYKAKTTIKKILENIETVELTQEA